MRTLLVTVMLLATPAVAQETPLLPGQTSGMSIARDDRDLPKKQLAIIEDGVVTNKIEILEAWEEKDWAPFVPEGGTAIIDENKHYSVGDRFIDGKVQRQFNMPMEDGWRHLVLGDVDNPPREPENIQTSEPWTLTPTWEPPAKEQVKSLEAKIELLQEALDAANQKIGEIDERTKSGVRK